MGLDVGRITRGEILKLVRESKIQRWEGFRLREDGSLMEIAQDGTLQEQLKGLTRHLRFVFDELKITDEKPEDVALAYVARQVDGCNFLLNAQGSGTRSDDAKRLRVMADELAKGGDSSLSATFNRVAMIQEGADLEQGGLKVKQALKFANQLFYVETAVRQLLRIPEMRDSDPDRKRSMMLAANAFGNNLGEINKEFPDRVKEIMEPLEQSRALRDLRNRAMDKVAYNRSVNFARRSSPSCHRTTTPPKNDIG